MRVLEPSGHLYVFCSVPELGPWLRGRPHPVDVLAWLAPNNPSVSAYWRRGTGGRAAVWRPIIHWQRDPRKPIAWPVTLAPYNPISGRRLEGDAGKFVDPNVYVTSSIQSNMHEALPWPDQLPIRLLEWLLRPHIGQQLLDLFSGTGTTRAAAIGLGMEVSTVELSPEALDIIRRRPSQLPLPDGR